MLIEGAVELVIHRVKKDIKVYLDELEDIGIMATPLEYMSPKLPDLGDVDWGKYVSALMDIGYIHWKIRYNKFRKFKSKKEDMVCRFW